YRFDPGLRSAKRPDHPGRARCPAHHSRGRRRGARLATSDFGPRAGVGPLARHARDCEIQGRTDRRPYRARRRPAMNPVDFARELIDIDSTTGRDQEGGEWLARSLRSLGYHVDEQPVANGRRNVIATIDSPIVVL